MTELCSNGYHASELGVPGNLCAKILTMLMMITLCCAGFYSTQGIRLIGPGIGETVVVSGLGLIGLLAVQILKANGCRVLGIDFDEKNVLWLEALEHVNLAEVEDPGKLRGVVSRGRGVDAGTTITATDSNEPISQAANMLRKRAELSWWVLLGLGFVSGRFLRQGVDLSGLVLLWPRTL